MHSFACDFLGIFAISVTELFSRKTLCFCNLKWISFNKSSSNFPINDSDALPDLVQFVQLNKREKALWRSVTFSIAGLSLQFY